MKLTDKYKGSVAVKVIADCAAPHGGWAFKTGEQAQVSLSLASYLVINKLAETVAAPATEKKGA